MAGSIATDSIVVLVGPIASFEHANNSATTETAAHLNARDSTDDSKGPTSYRAMLTSDFRSERIMHFGSAVSIQRVNLK